MSGPHCGGPGELVLGVGMPAQAALDKGGVGGEGLPGAGGCADLCGPVVRTERARLGLRFGRPGRRLQGLGELGEDVDEFGGELVEIVLHRAELAAGPPEEREVQASPVPAFERAEDGADVFLSPGQRGAGERLRERERAVQVQPPAGLRHGLLDPASGGAAVRPPDGGCLGDRARSARPGHDPVFGQAVVEHDVAGADPPDQREPGAALPVRAALRAVQVDAYVLAVGDLQPEALPGISGPPGALTGTLNGTAITMSIGLSQDLYGTLSGGQLTLNVPQQNGTIQAVTCRQASIDDWNKAVGVLNSQAGSDNQRASQAQAQASHDQAVSNAQGSLSRDMTSLQSDASSLENDNTLAGDVNTMKQDYQSEQNDWRTEQSDAGSCGVSGDAGAISGDASAIGGDQSALQADIGSLQSNGMAAVKTDISAIGSDVSAIRNLGATPSADPSGAIAAGNKALADARNAINWASNQGNQIVREANSLSNTAQSYANSHGC